MMELINKVFSFWMHKRGEFRCLFHEDFVYSGPSKLVSAEDWFYMIENGEPIADATMLKAICSGSEGMIMFDNIEPLTGLKYRVAWYLKFESKLVVELVEVSGVVQ